MSDKEALLPAKSIFCNPSSLQARIRGGHLPSPKFFKTLYSNFDILRNFQRIKMKAFFILLFVYYSEKFRKCCVCVSFDFVSCLSSEEESLHTLSKRQQ